MRPVVVRDLSSGRLRSSFANCSRVGVLIPLSFASRGKLFVALACIAPHNRPPECCIRLQRRCVYRRSLSRFSSFTFSASTCGQPHWNHCLMRFHIHQPPGPRDRRMIWHAFIQRDPHERSNGQTINAMARHAVPRSNRSPSKPAPPSAAENKSPVGATSVGLKTPASRNPHRLSRHTHPRLLLVQNLIQSVVKRMTGPYRQRRSRSSITPPLAALSSFVVPSP